MPREYRYIPCSHTTWAGKPFRAWAATTTLPRPRPRPVPPAGGEQPNASRRSQQSLHSMATPSTPHGVGSIIVPQKTWVSTPPLSPSEAGDTIQGRTGRQSQARFVACIAYHLWYNRPSFREVDFCEQTQSQTPETEL